MKFQLPMDVTRVIEIIESSLIENGLDSLVKVSVAAPVMSIDIKKMGTSKLSFKYEEDKGSTTFNLFDEDLAMLHRPYRGKILEVMSSAVIRFGGSILES